MAAEQQDRFLKPKEVLKLLGISAPTLYRLVAARLLVQPTMITPGRSSWRQSEIEAYIATCARRSPIEEPGAPQGRLECV
jgi:predicted DNA-binding transcriptional regulator AlpA